MASRPAEVVHQIEITSRCNLRCRYCPSPNLGRPKVDMSEEHFLRALEHVRATDPRKQVELNLAGIGESTLHPDFCRWVALACRSAPSTTQVLVTTNGLAFGKREADACAANGCRVFVSLHRPEAAQAAVHLCRERGILLGVSVDAAINSVNWAGQVDWPQIAPSGDCIWWSRGRVMVMADGRVTTCCFDASGVGVIGHVDQEMSEWVMRPYELCKTCHQNKNVPLRDLDD